ncbi:phthiotriol/phenolphthiotriol dimycocerosates methyltransferase [Mycobacterium sp.]|uniref:phthiotriol/phenolphthiotriol dimycocerosates methyltransferase n=1 Tax=Mycobacterium sp. TaxID=1785 RepID=UPI003F9AB870
MAQSVPIKTTLKTRVSDRLYPLVAWQRLQKRLYPILTKRTASSGELLLLNNGYEEDPPMAVPLGASDEPGRFQIQLYQRTAVQSQVDLRGKRVLEVGCGHGGGASYLTRTFGPKSYTGLDLNPAGIEFCRKTHNVPGLYFVQGDAENLPFPDESFDVVINIESSHCYPHFSRFMAEVRRVLAPGGHFQYTDFPHPTDEAWKATLEDSGMQMLSERNISAEIARGFKLNLPHLLHVSDLHSPALLRGLVRKVYGSKVLATVRELETGEQTYWMYSFAKA